MGLVAIGTSLLRSFLNVGAPGAGAALGRVLGGVGSATRALAPAAAGGAAAGLGFSAISSFFGGGGGAPAQVAAQATGQRGFVTLEDGGRILVSAQGRPIRATFFLPAGAKLPGGSTIVSVSPDGSLFGVKRGRRKRPAFKTEIDTCKTTIAAAKSLVKAAKG